MLKLSQSHIKEDSEHWYRRNGEKYSPVRVIFKVITFNLHLKIKDLKRKYWLYLLLIETILADFTETSYDLLSIVFFSW